MDNRKLLDSTKTGSFFSISACRNCLDSPLSTSPWCAVCDHDADLPSEFRCHRSKDISISSFDGHIAISGCRSLSQSHGHAFLKLSVIENPKFTVGISILTIIVSEINTGWAKKSKPDNFCNNFVYCQPISVIFGTYTLQEICNQKIYS